MKTPLFILTFLNNEKPFSLNSTVAVQANTMDEVEDASARTLNDDVSIRVIDSLDHSGYDLSISIGEYASYQANYEIIRNIIS